MRALRKLGSFLKPYWRWAALAPLMMALEVAMDLMQPRLVQRMVDQGIAHSDMALVLHTGALQVACAVIGMFAGMGCTYFAVLAGQGFGADLRERLFGKIQSLSFGNLDHLDTGSLITRLTNDVTQVQEVVMMVLRIMVRVPLLLVGSLIMGVLTSPRLSLLFLILIPVISAALAAIIRKTSPLYSQVQKRLDALNTVLQENLSGVRVVKAFARSQHEERRFADANDQLMTQNITAARLGALTMPVVMLTLNFGVVAALWFGGAQVDAGQLRIGQVIAFINYLMQTLVSLTMASMLILRFSRGEASALRIEEVLDSVPAIQPAPNAITLAQTRGRIVFEDVRFAYDGQDHDPVLTGVSFTAEPGQTVAILGATGAGKSSLVNLVPRFYDVAGGRVTIDGQDVRSLSEKSLRGHVGIALQESVLFSGSIRDNIKYGRPEASDDDVVAAAKMAQAHDFIMGFPEGYDTVVGQRGVNLSGGQKQRIAIARVLATGADILILDDSTSAVDVQTEARIQQALAEHREGRTSLVVAQRISTVLGADKILVLDDGRIAAEGTHRELLTSSPIYREIYESQMENGVITDGGE
ncbi:ABC transporter [Capsulimonas corticalis]|uniref:ABC transporter n=1 Tax=Capsulimonas corticalis TaxID=2219043 RepID=A0A402CZC7_9BACT|nr:ABC transporter ATP-binding protein [Capsulimonas corticalis]BDI29483.1 ABC transporter [Capsulimonas corticalis]